MSIVDSIVLSDRPYGQSTARKVVAQHTDHTGAIHKMPTTIIDSGFATNNDEQTYLDNSAAQLDAQLTESEQQHYINEISSGRNPFMPDGVNPVLPKFNDDGALRTIVLVRFLSMDDPTGLTAAVPLLSILTDQELMFLLDIDQLSVDKIRTVALDVGNIAEGINNYVPPLGGV